MQDVQHHHGAVQRARFRGSLKRRALAGQARGRCKIIVYAERGAGRFKFITYLADVILYHHLHRRLANPVQKGHPPRRRVR